MIEWNVIQQAKKDGCWMNQTEVWVNGVGLAKMNDFGWSRLSLRIIFQALINLMHAGFN